MTRKPKQRLIERWIEEVYNRSLPSTFPMITSVAGHDDKLSGQNSSTYGPMRLVHSKVAP
jgi:hypothetical protein